jgi:hypothetical protein
VPLPQRSQSYHYQGKQQLVQVASLLKPFLTLVEQESSSKTCTPSFVPSSSAITATLMTSFTTCVGFFAINASDVACIKLFGTFCGLLVAVDYVLSVLILSPVLCLYDSIMMRDPPNLCVSRQKMNVVKENASSDQEEDEEVTVGTHRNFHDRILGSYSDFLYSFR